MTPGGAREPSAALCGLRRQDCLAYGMAPICSDVMWVRQIIAEICSFSQILALTPSGRRSHTNTRGPMIEISVAL
jgi:hypothetical protein